MKEDKIIQAVMFVFILILLFMLFINSEPTNQDERMTKFENYLYLHDLPDEIVNRINENMTIRTLRTFYEDMPFVKFWVRGEIQNFCGD